MNQMKLAILGDGGVGKSAIVISYLENHFIEIYDPTIEDCYRKQITIDDHTYLIEILDTAGQEEYTAMRDQYMCSADGFVIVYDLTNYNTLRSVPQFIERIRMNRPNEYVPIVICGNKCDLWKKSKLEVSKNDISNLEMSLGQYIPPFYECSAKTRINIEEIWEDLIRQIIKKNQMILKKRKSRTSCIVL